MKYIRCPKCGINYIMPYEKLCSVCKNNVMSDIEEKDICPFCYKNTIDENQLMCEQCRNKRK